MAEHRTMRQEFLFWVFAVAAIAAALFIRPFPLKLAVLIIALPGLWVFAPRRAGGPGRRRAPGEAPAPPTRMTGVRDAARVVLLVAWLIGLAWLSRSDVPAWSWPWLLAMAPGFVVLVLILRAFFVRRSK